MTDQDKQAKKDAQAAKKALAAEQKARLAGRIRLIDGSSEEILVMLKVAQTRLLAILAAQPTESQQWMLPQVLDQVRKVLGEFGDQAGDRAAQNIGQAWDAGKAAIDEPLAAAWRAAGLHQVVAVPLVDTAQLLAMRAFATDRMRNVASEAINKINTELGLTVLGAQSQSEAVGAVTRILAEGTRARAITVVRTSMSQAYSFAEWERLQQQAQVVPGLQKQWRASGKAHPRHNHHIADGQIQPIDQPFNLGGVKMMYPHDPKAPASEVINCGCTMLSIVVDWESALATPGRKYDAGPTMSEILAKADSAKTV